jgi:lysyl-tRNA synthetase class 1
LAFDTEIYRQYDEFDRELSSQGGTSGSPMPFKQAVALGQITQWNEKKVLELVSDLEAGYDKKSVKIRLPKARAWLEKYNPAEAIVLRDSVNTEYAATLDEKTRAQVATLREKLEGKYKTIKDLEEMVYSIPRNSALDQKGNAPLQKAFFKHIYHLLISADQGPRLSTFLWAIDRKQVLKLLDI